MVSGAYRRRLDRRAIIYALHADLSQPVQPLQPRAESAPAQEQQKPSTNQERSSGRVALPVEVVPGPEHAADTAEQQRHADENAATEKDLADATWKLAYFTLALAAFAAGQVALFFWQLGLIRESLDDAKIAAEAARDGAHAATAGATAARDNADIARLTMISRDRAYLTQRGTRWISHRENDTGRIFWRIRPRWVNDGNTPTRNLRVIAQYELRDTELPRDFAFDPGTIPRAHTIGPKDGFESNFKELFGQDLVEIEEGRKFFYIWGVARYNDVFPGTPERVTKFCIFARTTAGDPLKSCDEKTNPFEIVFGIYDRHNCADEDCDTETERAHGASLPTPSPPCD